MTCVLEEGPRDGGVAHVGRTLSRRDLPPLIHSRAAADHTNPTPLCPQPKVALERRSQSLEGALAAKSDELRQAVEQADKAREGQRTTTASLNQALEREALQVRAGGGVRTV